MFGYAAFKAARDDNTKTVEIARFYDTKTFSRSNRLTAHEIGWTIRVRGGGPHVYGYFHVHWRPKDSEESALNNNISAHFKESHRGNRSSNRNTNAMDLKALDAAVMYNGLVILDARWDERSPSKPRDAATGFTPLASWITLAMVDRFKQNNNNAGLTQLAQNPLYDLARWDQQAWVSYLGWMTGS